MTLRDDVRAAIEDVECPHNWVDGVPGEDCLDCTTTAVMAVVDKAVWRAANVLRGRCRTCSGILDQELYPRARDFELGHRMRCRFYVGPLEHRWVSKRMNGTFGGLDHDCVCGGWFRQGGLAGHGDGSNDAEPICPNADQDWRGLREPVVTLSSE
jgi:hypothetical protein